MARMASAICSRTKVVYTRLADLLKKGFYSEHFHEKRLPALLVVLSLLTFRIYRSKFQNGC